jgi:hypothetical protein
LVNTNPCSVALASVIAIFGLGLGATARADVPRTLVISSIAEPGSPEAQVNDAVRKALGALSEVQLLPPSPLDLEAVQLALDCTGTCLPEIAERMAARIVIIPALKQRAEALELELTCFREDAKGPPRVAMRKQPGRRLDASLLDAVPSMVREVLELEGDEPSAAAAEPVPEPAAAAPIEDAEEPATATGSLPLGPALLGGGGVVLLAAGVVVGIVANATEDEYASRDVGNDAQAKAADDQRVTGENQALVANILLGTGAAAVVAAGIWYLLDGNTEHAPAQAMLRPALGPGTAGLVLAGHWESSP